MILPSNFLKWKLLYESSSCVCTRANLLDSAQRQGVSPQSLRVCDTVGIASSCSHCCATATRVIACSSLIALAVQYLLHTGRQIDHTYCGYSPLNSWWLAYAIIGTAWLFCWVWGTESSNLQSPIPFRSEGLHQTPSLTCPTSLRHSSCAICCSYIKVRDCDSVSSKSRTLANESSSLTLEPH